MLRIIKKSDYLQRDNHYNQFPDSLIFTIVYKQAKNYGKIGILSAVALVLTFGTIAISPAFAAPTTIISGRGSRTYTCANGTDNPGLGFGINVQKVKGKGQTFKLAGSGEFSVQVK